MDTDDYLQPVDRTKLRYALYVRKSTDDDSKQLRSLDDQIAECEAAAKRLGIYLVKPYLREKKSAKISNNRPVFTKMLQDIRQGTYDGIMAWHPDRLARNMREGGELIDMLDERVLKDLCFVTHYFTNDANGKMLLGMAFVFSKHYSDDLSQKVTRGVRRSFWEGKSSGTPKYGYIRDEQGIYQPDGRNFELTSEAWWMRKNGATYREIADFLKREGFGRRIKGRRAKRKGQVIVLDWRRLTKMFSDPFYYGVLVQAGKTVDLRTLPGYNFQPAVSEEDWQHVQALAYTRRRRVQVKERKPFYPLKGLVKCLNCGHAMYAGASKGHKRYLYYRCDTKGCSRTPKSIRANKVFDGIYRLFEGGLGLTAADYEHYRTRLGSINERKREQLAIKLHSAQGARSAVQRDITDRSLAIVNYDKDSTIWKVNNEEIKKLAAQLEGLEHDITHITQDMHKVEGQSVSIEQFLNLSKLAGIKLKSAGPAAKDRVCRMVFLNLVVDTEKVVDFKIREPFASLVESKKFLSGAPEATKLELLDDLYNAIVRRWDASELKNQTDLDALFDAPETMTYVY